LKLANAMNRMVQGKRLLQITDAVQNLSLPAPSQVTS
jgi:hypothetical protein